MLKLQFVDQSKPDLWLVDPLLKVGSDASCNIVINEDGVEPFHFELHVNDQVVTLKHKAQNRSTYVNDSLVPLDQELKPWDVIRVGSVQMRLIDPLLNRSPIKSAVRQETVVRPAISDWLLQAQTSPYNGQLFPVNESLVIGRDHECDISVPLQHVSRRHARVYINNGQLYLEDMGSSNGTYVDGKKVDSMPLNDGDEFTVDKFSFKVLFAGDINPASHHPSFSSSTEKKAAAKRPQTQIRGAKDAPKMKPELAATRRYNTPPVMDIPTDPTPAFLHGKSQSLRGKVYQLNPEGNAVGRMLGHHLSRDETSVSARHIDIFKEGTRWHIKNNGAANGLLINGRMATSATLTDGDEIIVGGMELVFQGIGNKPRVLFEEEEGNTAMILKVSGIFLAVVGVLVAIMWLR
ncbi:FHA domain-containing protein [Pleionea sp. CnH1-48]|uniref:FHA domain-containing protein n=1 Tax=Pleionea sp. CnH1-48 TaxID=2954494 RepID=UPI00209793D2|nr:FHA domain-containing protein [Pleionea sp. CnH1-48]MCO7226783.1 FHA domain-containing protein [Pleionea sp. CnH1-48]